MTDLSTTIAPKSDQLNADDLIAGPRTITITSVRGCDDPDQPVAVHFEGDNKKPYKPCKSMRRVMVHCWGADGNTYPGRRMTLYRDESVQFGGIKVGGIRISHMSHIDRETVLALTATRAKRTPYTVKPLQDGPRDRKDAAPKGDDFPGDRGRPQAPATDAPALTLSQRADAYETRIMGAPSTVKLKAIQAAAARLNEDLDRADPERKAELDQLWSDRFDELAAREAEGA